MSNTLSGKGTRRTKRRLSFVPILSIFMLGLSVGLFVLELVQFSQREDRLPDDLVVGGVASGAILPAEAVILWEQTFISQPVTIFYGNSPIVLDPTSIGFRVNWQTMLAETQSAAESEGSFWIRFFNYLTQQDLQQSIEVPLYANYQEGLLRQFLTDISLRYDRSSGSADIDVQTLSTFSGATGSQLDVDQAVALVDLALRDPENRTVQLPVVDSDMVRPGLETLERLIKAYLDAEDFIYDSQNSIASIFILDLNTGEELNILGDVAFSAASTMKVAILIDYYRYLTTPPTQDEAWLMANSLLCSNNSSSNLLMQISGGGVDVFSGLVNVTTTAQTVGARNTFIRAPFVEGVANQQLGSIQVGQTSPNPNYSTDPDIYNQTTAEDLGTMFNMIYDCANYGSGLMTAYPGEFSQRECRQMIELMSANDLLRLLQAGIPDEISISHKNGWTNEMVGDAGIVFPPNGNDYIISILLWEETEDDFQDFQRLWPIVEGISRAAWNYFSPEEPLRSARSDVPPTAQECEGNYLPPNAASVNLDDIDSWRVTP